MALGEPGSPLHTKGKQWFQQKRNELEATVQLLNKQITANATTQEIAATTRRVMMVARELASANSALSKALTS